MEFVLALGLFLLGLVLGWMLGWDSGLKSGQQSATRLEKAYWLGTVQQLESQIRKEQAKVKVLKSDLAWEKLQRMKSPLDWDHKK